MFQQASLTRAGIAIFLLLLAAIDLGGQDPTRGLKPARAGVTSVAYGKSHALVVGVGKYLKGWQQLRTVPTDVALVKAALERQGFADAVRVVDNPTLAEFRTALQAVLANAAATDRVVVYFGGHGYTRVNAKDGSAKGYLILADTPLPTATDDAAVASGGLAVDELYTASVGTRAKHVLVILDSCFSGSLLEVRSESVAPHIADLLDQPVRLFITAGSANQTVPAESIFTPRLVRGLAGEADMSRDGYVTGVELGMFLHQQVTDYSSGAQTPRWGKVRDRRFDQGDIVFRVPTTATAPPAASTPLQMAFRLREGRGVPKDTNAAIEQFEIACKAGELSACRDAGRLLTNEQPTPERDVRAFRLFDYACKRGHLPGCRAVGWAYLNARGTAGHIANAIAVLEPACRGGDAPSCVNLAEAFWTKASTDQSAAFRAVNLWRDACYKSVAQGCWSVGEAYAVGEKHIALYPPGAIYFEHRALQLFELACDNNDAQACFQGAVGWKEGVVRMPDQTALASKIAGLLTRGCQLGSQDACTELTGRKR